MGSALRVRNEFAKNIFPGGWWEIYVWGFVVIILHVSMLFIINITAVQLWKVQLSIILKSSCSFHGYLTGVLNLQSMSC